MAKQYGKRKEISASIFMIMENPTELKMTNYNSSAGGSYRQLEMYWKMDHEEVMALAKELDITDLLVGHAYFIGKTEEDLCSIFNRSIIPLLYEYFYDNSTKVKAQIKNALPNDQYEITGGTVGRIKISKK